MFRRGAIRHAPYRFPSRHILFCEIALLKPTPFQSQTAHTKHPSDARRCRIHVHDVDHFNRDPLVRDCSRWHHRRYLFQQRRPRTDSHVASKYERASLILIISLRHCGTTYLFLKLIAADAIVVWRMLVLYPNKVVRVGILFLLFSFSTLALFNSIGEPADGPFERALILSTVASFLSFGTNLIATAAISWKAWTYQRRNPHSWRGTESSNAVNSAFILLIETGLLTSSATGLQWCTSVQYASNALAESTTIIAALYPTSTLVIVALKKSIADKCGPLHRHSQSSLRSSEGKVMLIQMPQDAWQSNSGSKFEV
ncbi:hypothetical protein B0H14DRAFT_2894730 [Mycena olivaceomarginata]|nr:hypothetical protein B0H14DRAFT_2894730 [Mycena olivaceomarginata]